MFAPLDILNLAGDDCLPEGFEQNISTPFVQCLLWARGTQLKKSSKIPVSESHRHAGLIDERPPLAQER